MGMSRQQAREMGFDPDDRIDRSGGEVGGDASPDLREPNAVTFAVPGRPPRKGQGKSYIKRNQREQRRVKSAAMARLLERGDLRRWPVDQTCALSVVAVYPDRNHADLSNIVKAVEDGLNGVLWSDDKRVLSYREPTEIEFTDHLEEGRTVVRVEVLE